MTKIISFFVRYRIWTNVLMFGIFGFGLISLSNLRYSFFPEIAPNLINISVVYPGASPTEVEEGVILKIEENLDGLDGIERVTSVSRENFGTVNVETIKDANIDKVLTDVKNSIDRINSFPVDAEKPIIFEQKFRSRALSVVLFGEADLYNLKYIAENFRDELLATPYISQVDIEGIPNLEFSIEVSESNLRKYKLNFNQIASAISSFNINISGGKFDTKDEEILIRAYGRGYRTQDLLDIPVKSNPDGRVIYLKDIADVKEKWEDVPDKRYYNARNAAILNIDQTEQEDITVVAEKVKEFITGFNKQNTSIQALVLDDRTVTLNQRLELLVRNGIAGLVLVVLLLGFFLNLRLSFWVSIGIPFSFAGMFIVAGFLGLTINVISLFGMIIVVGILVDDAIVVGENIYAHYEAGKPAIQAAIEGTKEMVAPVTTSILTTILAFTPFFFLDGTFGRFIWQMAAVVVAVLLFSLVEAFLILPAHLAHSKGLHPHKDDSPIRQKIEKFINNFTHNIYSPALKAALKHKWITLVTPIALVLMTIGLIRGGFIGLTFFPFIDGDTLPINVSLVSGRQEADTDSLLSKLEKISWEVNETLKAEKFNGEDVILGIKRDIGTNDLGESGSHIGRITLQLMDGETRNMDSYVIANMIREAAGSVPEADKVTFGRFSFFGKPVSVSLLGSDVNQLKLAKEMLISELNNISSLKDVTDSDQEGRRELDIKLKPRAYALGLTLRDVAGQVRQGFFGQEIQRIQRGRDEIRVWVRYLDADRSALGFLDQMRIRTPQGQEYPFSELAEYKIDRGITVINRLDRKREIKVEANLSDEKLDLPPILENIQKEIVPKVLSQVEGVTASFEGQSRDQEKFAKSMARAFPLALLGMLILMVLVFRSYLQAGLIFAIIPLGLLGASWGHGIHNVQLNTLSIYGFIALSGIIINDSIVLIDQINRNLRAGLSVVDAVHKGAVSRLRPIVLTTMTTAVGLAPIIAETSRQAQFLIPMAISVAYGLLFGTIILLFIAPAGFLVMNKIRFWFAKFAGNDSATYESVEPAVKEILTSGS